MTTKSLKTGSTISIALAIVIGGWVTTLESRIAVQASTLASHEESRKDDKSFVIELAGKFEGILRSIDERLSTIEGEVRGINQRGKRNE